MEDYVLKPKRRGMWPVLGLLMAVAAGGFAYVIGPRLIPVVQQITRGGFTGNELPRNQMELAFMAITFLIIIAFGGLILALFIPKKKTRVKESDLRKQRQHNVADDRRRRVRARVIEHETRKRNKRLS